MSRIILVPSGDAPHKVTLTPFADRLQLLNATVGGDSLFEIDTIESTLEGKTYSYNVIRLLKEKYGDIVFLIGADSLVNLYTWYRYADLIKLCPFAVIGRGSVADEKVLNAAKRLNAMGGDITLLSVKGECVSSSMARAAVELGVEDSFVSPECLAKIKELGLYHNYAEHVDKVKNALSAERFKHTCGVVFKALEYNSVLGLPYEKVFLSALLHDCAKYLNKVHCGVPLDCIGTPVMHAFNGAEEARINYGITDGEIISAIRYHTTGKPAMSLLDKLIYCADLVEPSRDFKGVEELRNALSEDFEQGFRACLKVCYDHLLTSGKAVYPLTVDCYNYYFKGGRNDD